MELFGAIFASYRNCSVRVFVVNNDQMNVIATVQFICRTNQRLRIRGCDVTGKISSIVILQKKCCCRKSSDNQSQAYYLAEKISSYMKNKLLYQIVLRLDLVYTMYLVSQLNQKQKI